MCVCVCLLPLEVNSSATHLKKRVEVIDTLVFGNIKTKKDLLRESIYFRCEMMNERKREEEEEERGDSLFETKSSKFNCKKHCSTRQNIGQIFRGVPEQTNCCIKWTRRRRRRWWWWRRWKKGEKFCNNNNKKQEEDRCRNELKRERCFPTNDSRSNDERSFKKWWPKHRRKIGRRCWSSLMMVMMMMTIWWYKNRIKCKMEKSLENKHRSLDTWCELVTQKTWATFDHDHHQWYHEWVW